jgi:hypothetical protein
MGSGIRLVGGALPPLSHNLVRACYYMRVCMFICVCVKGSWRCAGLLNLVILRILVTLISMISLIRLLHLTTLGILVILIIVLNLVSLPTLQTFRSAWMFSFTLLTMCRAMHVRMPPWLLTFVPMVCPLPHPFSLPFLSHVLP